jgi:hypothetical protein
MKESDSGRLFVIVCSKMEGSHLNQSIGQLKAGDYAPVLLVIAGKYNNSNRSEASTASQTIDPLTGYLTAYTSCWV